jgi:hypothetical protein
VINDFIRRRPGKAWKLIAAGAGDAQWSGPLYPKVPAVGATSANCSADKPCLFEVRRLCSLRPASIVQIERSSSVG